MELRHGRNQEMYRKGCLYQTQWYNEVFITDEPWGENDDYCIGGIKEINVLIKDLQLMKKKLEKPKKVGGTKII